MLSFFPSCYEDELLYSVFARYHQRSGNPSFKSTLIELFNTDSSIAVTDFPSGLGALSKKLQPLYSSNYLIENHTLVPYFRPFLNKEIHKNVINLMNSQSSNGAHTSMGIIQSSVSQPRYLKLCKGCFREDEFKYGEPYWHRCHQLPGVFLCPIHGEELINSNVPFKQQESVQKFYALSNIKLDSVKPVHCIKDEAGVFNYIAKESYNLLRTEIFPLGFNNLRDLYLYFMAEKNFLTSSGRIKFKYFFPSFVNFFGRDLLEFLNCELKEGQEDTWLHRVLRKPRVSCHPLRHLLLLHFFNQNINSLLFVGKNNYLANPFGMPMYPCLNKAADHYRENVVNDLKVTRCSRTGKPVGTFTCECGFIYSRKGPDTSLDDKYRIGKVKQFGHVWEKKLKELCNKGFSKHKIAEELRADYSTVKKYIDNWGVSENKAQSKTDNLNIKKNNNIVKKEEYRSNWLNHVTNNPNKSRTELREGLQRVYIWLYRHDRDWLYEHLPPKVRNNNRYNRVDWGRRDNEIAILIRNEIDKLVALDPPERITISKIGQRIQKSALLEKKLEKLPKCKEILEGAIETIEEFRMRRVETIVLKKREEYKEVKLWEIIREAGLPMDYGEVLNQTFQDDIHFY